MVIQMTLHASGHAQGCPEYRVMCWYVYGKYNGVMYKNHRKLCDAFIHLGWHMLTWLCGVWSEDAVDCLVTQMINNLPLVVSIVLLAKFTTIYYFHDKMVLLHLTQTANCYKEMTFKIRAIDGLVYSGTLHQGSLATVSGQPLHRSLWRLFVWYYFAVKQNSISYGIFCVRNECGSPSLIWRKLSAISIIREASLANLQHHGSHLRCTEKSPRLLGWHRITKHNVHNPIMTFCDQRNGKLHRAVKVPSHWMLVDWIIVCAI